MARYDEYEDEKERILKKYPFEEARKKIIQLCVRLIIKLNKEMR